MIDEDQPSNSTPVKIVCAALRRTDGKIICGARHYDMFMMNIIDLNQEDRDLWRFSEQGFIDNKGNFRTREEAWKIACDASQVNRTIDCNWSGILFSEDLY